jgi:hypothetical protein
MADRRQERSAAREATGGEPQRGSATNLSPAPGSGGIVTDATRPQTNPEGHARNHADAMDWLGGKAKDREHRHE